jgi:metal-sulfur cluster biosynthetic enzyme
MGMSDERPINPHTGQPVPDDPASIVDPNRDASASSSAPAGATAPSPNAGETSAPSQQELAIRSALETVMDPEIGLSVIDLGLIREVHVHPDRTHVRMMLTTPFCPYAPQMVEDVKQATMSVVPLACEVELMPDAWSPELMPDPGLLGYSF